ncbi:MAG: hypothetical protein WA843_01085 [Candidatus Saccharimonadales bacterium]
METANIQLVGETVDAWLSEDIFKSYPELDTADFRQMVSAIMLTMEAAVPPATTNELRARLREMDLDENVLVLAGTAISVLIEDGRLESSPDTKLVFHRPQNDQYLDRVQATQA